MISYKFILEKFNSGDYNGKNFREIAVREKATDKKTKNSLRLILEQLERDGEIRYVDDRYRIKLKRKKKRDDYLVGIVNCNERGFGFLTVDGYKEDFFIPSRKMGGAFQGDTVKAKLIQSAHSDDEVEVIEVVKRGITKLTGTFYNDGKVNFLRPDDRGYLYDVILPRKCENVEIGDKAVVEITAFPENGNPKGRIVQVLGKSLELKTEEAAIIIGSQIKEEFDEKTLEEATLINQEVGDNQLIGRLDLRNKLIFTIDGETARDFDDAVSLEINSEGNFVLGVHIADVSEYVKTGTSLEKEAFERSTSVYLPDRVIPMLPFELSNGICSLNEGVDRLTLSVIAEIGQNGKTLKCNFYKSVIKSSHRLTYALVQKIIDGDKEAKAEYDDIVPTVEKMYRLKQILEKNRKDNGEIDLSVKEADVFETDGKITVSEHKTNDATNLIEQFMIFANERVAEFLFRSDAPCVYRVHDKPSAEKITLLRSFLNQLGIPCDISGEEPKEYAGLLDELKGDKRFTVVNRMILRSMQKAEYSERNVGHFGLASKCYLHFTSPIRRYPDLVVHRILKTVLDGKKSQLNDLYADFVKKAAENSSLKERKADLCERTVDDLYKVFYMEDFVGSEFDGTVSGVTNFGVFVELDNTIEGLIRLENLPGQNYTFNEERMCLKSGKRSFSLGDRVHIGVVGVSVASRRVEFILLRKNKE